MSLRGSNRLASDTVDLVCVCVCVCALIILWESDPFYHLTVTFHSATHSM